MSLKNIKKNRYARNIARDKWLIISIVFIMVFWAGVYILISYKPIYSSNAKIWVKSSPAQTFVDMNSPGAQTPPNDSLNPISTQLDILGSYSLMADLAKYIEKKYPEDLKGVKDKVKAAKSLVKTDNKTGSETIDLSVTTDSPVKSKDLLQFVLNDYLNMTMALDNKSQKRIFIDNQIDKIGNRLVAVRNRIRHYQANTLAANIDTESSGLVTQKLAFISQLENVNASINDNMGKIRSYQKRLSLNVDSALNAVALGSGNENLNKLRATLNETQQQYVLNSINLAYTNPKMVAMKKQIDTIKGQIQDQIKLTLGSNASDQAINILDPAREKIVEELAMAHANLIGLRSQKRSLLSSIARINSYMSTIPGKKFILDNLSQEEKNLSNAYDVLRIKQIEARLKEAETFSNITIVDMPNVPVSKTFPTKKHILLFAIIMGFALGMGASLIKTNLEDICEGADEIKEVTKAPILGAMPWSKNIYDEKNQFTNNFAVKNIASNLIYKCYKKNIRVITLSSTSSQKSNTFFVSALANCIRKLGYRIAVVDADLALPMVRRDMGPASYSRKSNLSDLILEIDNEDIYDDTHSELILKYLAAGENGVKILGNVDPVESPYEYFGSFAFNKIISVLKNNFDIVLIDCPSATIAPEFTIISESSDGVILLANLKVTYANLERITQKLKDSEIPLLGSIIKEQDSVLEKDYLESTKRLIVNGIKTEEEEEVEV